VVTVVVDDDVVADHFFRLRGSIIPLNITLTFTYTFTTTSFLSNNLTLKSVIIAADHTIANTIVNIVDDLVLMNQTFIESSVTQRYLFWQLQFIFDHEW